MLFPLHLAVEGDAVVARGSVRAYRLRGLLALFVLPFAFGVLVAVLGGMLDLTEDVAWVVWLSTAALSVAFGLGLLVGADALAGRRAVRFDRARQVVVAAGAEQPFAGLTVQVRRPSPLGFSRLELVRDGVPVVTVHDRLGEPHGAEIAIFANYLASVLGSPGEVSGGPPAGEVGAGPTAQDRTAAMLCYLPIQGIHLVASLYYLFSARDRPFVRFAARQSLAQLGVTFGAVLLALLGLGAPLAWVSQGQGALPASGIGLAIALGLALMTVFVAHIVAAMRAYRGEAWVIPWLARWFRAGP